MDPVGQEGPGQAAGVTEYPFDGRALVGDQSLRVDDGDHVAGVLGQRPEPGLASCHVLEGGAGQGPYEGGELELLRTEQAPDLAVGHIETAPRNTLSEDLCSHH